MALTQQTASLVSPENSTGSATLILAVLVVVDIGFAGGGAGLTGGCGGGIVVNEVVRAGGLVVGTAGDAVVTKGVTGGKGLVTGMLDWEPEGGSEAMRLGGEGRDAGLVVY